MTRQIIERTPSRIPRILAARKRVCAYVRVSTGHEAQLESFESQKEYYERTLAARLDVDFVGIFSDAGISGAKAKRPGFLQMMAEARKGNLDLIVTKSISRFARNTVMLLESIRELKSLGVAVEFEKEKINTLSCDGELMLSILASVAEEERKQVSTNIKWSIRTRYSMGKTNLNFNRVYGFTQGRNGIEISEAEAEIVRRIFRQFLEGKRTGTIAKELNRDGVPNKSKGPKWTQDRVWNMLINEKYCGDVLTQKTHIDARGHEMDNRGVLPMYYIHEHHPAIISKADFQRAQDLMKQYSPATYPWSRLLRCPLCGAVLIRQKSPWKIQWNCLTYLRDGRSTCVGIKVPESVLIGKTFTEPMIVEEITDDEGQKRYYFTPEAEYRRA